MSKIKMSYSWKKNRWIIERASILWGGKVRTLSRCFTLYSSMRAFYFGTLHNSHDILFRFIGILLLFFPVAFLSVEMTDGSKQTQTHTLHVSNDDGGLSGCLSDAPDYILYSIFFSRFVLNFGNIPWTIGRLCCRVTPNWIGIFIWMVIFNNKKEKRKKK